MTVDHTTHGIERTAFFKKHGGLNKVETSSMDEYGRYSKYYIAEDGKIWHECYGPVWEVAEATVEVRGIKVKISEDVKMFRTEYWNDDDANSRYMYDRW